MDNLLELASRLRELRTRKAEIKAVLDEVSKEAEKTEWALVQAMTLAEVDKFSQGGNMFSLNCKTRARTPEAKMPALVDELRDRGLDGIVKTTIQANTLSAFVKEQTENNEGVLPTWLVPHVEVYIQDTISMRKS